MDTGKDNGDNDTNDMSIIEEFEKVASNVAKGCHKEKKETKHTDGTRRLFQIVKESIGCNVSFLVTMDPNKEEEEEEERIAPKNESDTFVPFSNSVISNSEYAYMRQTK
jgi:sarcosine oxidase delta subunit